MKPVCFIPLLLLSILSSCNKASITGTGPIAQTERRIPHFHSIRSNADITVHVQYAPEQSVSVKGYQNLLNITDTKWVNGELVIQYKPAYCNVRNSNVEVFVFVPAIREIATNGSGDVDLHDFLLNDSLNLSIHGSSDIILDHSTFSFAKMTIKGSGNIYAWPAMIHTLQAAIHGSGDIETDCREKLFARIRGSGHIRYQGKPSLDVQISGSGTVIPN